MYKKRTYCKTNLYYIHIIYYLIVYLRCRSISITTFLPPHTLPIIHVPVTLAAWYRIRLSFALISFRLKLLIIMQPFLKQLVH